MIAKPISPTEILSQGWRFTTNPEGCGEMLGWQATDYDTRNWQLVSVPHTWNTIEEYSSYEGIAWYRVWFDYPYQADEACVRLKFDAVFYLARVWLNGEYLGEHEVGSS